MLFSLHINVTVGSIMLLARFNLSIYDLPRRSISAVGSVDTFSGGTFGSSPGSMFILQVTEGNGERGRDGGPSGGRFICHTSNAKGNIPHQRATCLWKSVINAW